MSDYISREKAIKSICQYGTAQEKIGRYAVTISELKQTVADTLSDLPSADVRENIHGEWIKIQSGDKDFPESIVCSKCKNANSHLDFNEHDEPIGKVFVTSKFCPNCGAKMKGGE